MALSKKLLQRRWVHAHEDDTATTTVYRPADYDLPPSRGRRSFELGAGGRYAESAPGPVDTPVAAGAGTWRIDGDTITIEPGAGRPARVLAVVTLERDRLVIRK